MSWLLVVQLKHHSQRYTNAYTRPLMYSQTPPKVKRQYSIESQVKKCRLESIKKREREKAIHMQPARVLRQEGRQRYVSLTIGTWRRLGTGSPHIQGSLLLRNTVEPTLMDILYSGYLIIQDKMLRSELKLHYA